MDGKLCFIREPEVRRRTGLSHSTIWIMRNAGDFPQPVKLGSRALGWVEHEIDEWLDARLRAREAA
ncbi:MULTISPECIES: helix-turn-helix transcriptional regulator [Sphingobium]|uniref:helix-turn-helix transcriptional regulator n=1 Tax=Sphingobium TaxID=165695 RepID=UPI000E72FA73|nr:AlpA family transcriptional regulator [Sphingobium limneticum]